MLGVGVVPFTMESLGAYLFAGAFRFIPLAAFIAGPKRRQASNVLIQKRGNQAAIDALLPAGRGLVN